MVKENTSNSFNSEKHAPIAPTPSKKLEDDTYQCLGCNKVKFEHLFQILYICIMFI